MQAVHELFEAQAKRTPDAIAVEINSQQISYTDLDLFANRVASGLCARGIKPGDFVGICLDRSFEMVAGILGILKAGAIYVPMDPEYPKERLAYMLEDSGVTCLLTETRALDALGAMSVGVEIYDLCVDFEDCDNSSPEIASDPERLIYMIYTSGSTGKPKGSLLYHKGFSNLVNWYTKEMALDQDSRVLHMTSPAFDLTQKNLFAPLLSGGRLVLLNQRFYDTDVIIEHISRYAISVVNCTPSAFSRLLSYAGSETFERLASLKYVVLGGEPIQMHRLIDWLSNPLCDAQVVNSYGPTECTDVVSFFRVEKPSDYLDNNVPIGAPVPGFDLRVVDESFSRLPDGEVGQLAIAGIGVGAGYHGKPEMTDKVFVKDVENQGERLYLTGDSARILPDGNIDYLGRIDNQVKIRGNRIELGEIERTLEAHADIAEAACSTYKDKSGDNKLSAFLVYEDAANPPPNNVVRKHLQQTLPDFMMPTAWLAMDKLPLTPNGKLDRKQLPPPIAKRPTLDVKFAKPDGEVQEYIASIWLELLGLDEVGVNDKFFELGGSSLNAVDFIARLSSELKQRIPITSFFDSPTIAGFELALWSEFEDALQARFPDVEPPKSTNDFDIEELLKEDQVSGESADDIAIIGISGRFPGADGPDALWENLIEGHSAVQYATDEELRELGVSEDDIADPEYVRAYYSMDDVENFDAEFFGYQPREVASMDPQHRLFLELAWNCLDNAGYARTEEYKGRIGVFGGVARDAYLVNFVAKHPDYRDRLEEFTVNMGNDKNFPASRISYKFNLSGPAINVQTACSSSGVALHMACQSLRSGDSDMALVGGCRVLVPTKKGYRYVEGSALSRDGHIYAFDERGSGMVRGSGGAFLLIKPLQKAIADGDCIRGIIKSTAINNDGNAKVGFTAPSVEGQAKVVAKAIAQSGVPADTIQYIEAHGTATALGDPIEVRALSRAFKKFTDAKNFCGIGSVKTNIGHLDAGAAVSGIVKTLLAMEQQKIPASLNFRSANNDIDFANGPFAVVDKMRDWQSKPDAPQRAGVSSFGLGGTNFHAVLEAAGSHSEEASCANDDWHVIALSAKSDYSLHANINGLGDFAAFSANQKVNAGNLAFSINNFRPQFSHRAVLLLPPADNLQMAIDNSFLMTADCTLDNSSPLFKSKCSVALDASAIEKFAPAIEAFLNGETADWSSLYTASAFRKTPLPNFKFERRRYWAEMPSEGNALYLHSSGESGSASSALRQWQSFVQQVEESTLEQAINPSAVANLARADKGSCRTSVLANSKQQLANGLHEDALQQSATTTSAVFMFPGGGAQYLDMGKGLYHRFDIVRDTLDRGFIHYERLTGVDLKAIWFARDDHAEAASETLLRPSIQLPALFLIEYALSEFWQSLGLKPAALVGHSMGENTAACVAGVLSFEDTLSLVTLRGQLFEQVDSSGMLSVNLSAEEARAHLGEALDLATVNGPEQSTISGRVEDIHQLKETLDQQGVDAQIVPINIAAHSRLLDPILATFRDFVSSIKLSAPKLPFVSNLTGEWISDEDAISADYWANHLRGTVRFADNVKNLMTLENPVFIECGPGKILGTLVSLQNEERQAMIVPSLRHPKEQCLDTDLTLQTLGHLWSAGIEFDWSKVNALLPGSVKILAELPPSSSLSDVQSSEEHTQPAKSYETRLDFLLDNIKNILQELSGIPAADLSESISFLELGFDSLFLTQANLRFKKAFAVKLSLRQLLKDAPTIEALASYIDTTLPDDALADEVKGLGNTTAGKASAASSTEATPQTSDHSGGESVQAGPYRAIEKSVSSDLSTEQSTYLEDFKQRYIARTSKSQAFNEEHREHYADPRTVMGFKQAWKDLTYTLVAETSKGSRVVDIDGNEYIDCMSGFGAIYFGHAPDFVQTAVLEQINRSVDYGPQSQLAGPTAKMICDMTGMERASFCNTGSEAVLAAIRISRTVTGNDLIVTFSGDYHGMFDEVLVKSQTIAGRRRNMPVAPGIPESANQNVLVLEYGDPSSIDIIRERAHEIAAVLIEPVQSRRPELQPKAFLQGVREATRDADIPMIFDEIITGFRLHPKGAQGWFDVDVDIACYGKVIGGGYPVGVIAGKRKYIDALDGGHWSFGDDSFPEVGVTYFAGTFIRHPVPIAAVNAVMHHLVDAGPELQESTNLKTALFAERINRIYRSKGIPVELNYFGSVYFPRFYGNPDYEGLFAHHLRFFGAHHIWGGRPGFLTTAHSDADIDFLVEAFVNAGTAMQQGHFLPAYKEVEAFYPWTEQQAELWLAHKMSDQASLAYNEQVVFELDSVLDTTVLAEAIDKVVNRHQSLRSVVSSDEKGMNVKTYVKPELEIHDPGKAEDTNIEALLCNNIDKPFDFYDGPLLRALYLVLPENKSVLAICASHLVIDGWSFEKTMEEIAGYYTSVKQGRYFDAGEPARIDAYQQELNEKNESGDLDAASAFWGEQYVTLPPDLELPREKTRPSLKTFNGERFISPLGGDYLDGLRDIARRCNSTMFIVLLTAYYLTLSRLSGNRDLVVGIPAAGQPHLGLNKLVAHMVSFLPVRVQIEGDETFEQLVNRVNEIFFAAKDHQDISYGQLLKQLDVPRDASRLPLLATSFNMDMPYNDIVFDGHAARFRTTPRSFVKYDLFINATDMGERLDLEVDFNTDLYEKTSVDNWIELFEQTLILAARSGDKQIKEFYREQSSADLEAIANWNATEKDFGLDQLLLHQTFERAADSHATLPALIDDRETLSYLELEKRANCFANFLLDNGISVEDRVALCLDRSNAMVVAILGTLKAGAAYIPLDPDHPADRIEFILNQSDARALVTESSRVTKLPDHDFTIEIDSDWSKISKASNDRPTTPAKPDNLAYVIYTSGSTGEPKGVMVEHRAICNHTLWMDSHYQLDHNHRVLQKTPYTFDVSLWEFFLPLMSGAQLILAKPEGHKDSRYIASVIREHRITHVHFVASMLKLFLQLPDIEQQCQSLQCVLTSGEAVTPALEEAYLDRLGDIPLWNMYGPTEAAVHTTVWQCKIGADQRSVPIGVPVANTKLYVVDDDLQALPVGSTGELLIGGVQVARGYLGKPELSAQRFVQDPFSNDPEAKVYRTGDLVYYRNDGVIEYIGRNDFQVKIRGLRIELGEIESALTAIAGVNQCCVIEKEENGNTILVAYLVSNTESFDVGSLRSQLRSTLPEYMIPQYFVAIKQMPLTSSGKTDRNALGNIAYLPTRADDDNDTDQPSTDEEIYLARLWMEALGDEQIYRDDNFFDIGGHSLLSAEIANRIATERGIEVPLRAFITGTLASIAATYLSVEELSNQGDPTVEATRNQAAAHDANQGSLWNRLFKRK